MKQTFLIFLFLLSLKPGLLIATSYDIDLDSKKNSIHVLTNYAMGQYFWAYNENLKDNPIGDSLVKDYLSQPSSAHSPESRLRRFETLFFISLPFTFVLSGFSVYLYAITNEISFTTMNKSYSATVAASTVFLSTAVSIHGTFFSCSVSPEKTPNQEKTKQTFGFSESSIWYFSWHKKIK